LRTLTSYLLLTLLCLLLFVPGINTLPVVDRDSAHFSQATKQMLETGNYFQIRYQETTRFQKPPGINWLQALSVKLIGGDTHTILAYRLPSVLGALLAVLLLFSFARPICGQPVALLASALLAVTLLLTVEAHMAVTDTMLLAMMILMQGALWRIYLTVNTDQLASWLWPIVFWLAMSAGFLIKGITPLVGLLTLAALAIAERRWQVIKYAKPLLGIIIFAATSSWLLWLNQAEQSNYLSEMVAKDLWPKLISGHESHGAPPGYHLILLSITFWPASLFLWQAGVWGWRFRKHPTITFLLAWLLPSFIFYELMPTKLPQYVLPLLPALALLAAFAVIKADDSPITGKHWSWLRFLYLLWGLFSIGLAASLIILPILTSNNWLLASIIAGSATIITVIVALIAVFNRYFKVAAVAVILGTLAIYPPTLHFTLPQLKTLWLTEQVMELIEQQDIAHEISAQHPLIAIGYREPSLTFRLGTFKVHYVADEHALAFLQQSPPALALITRTLWEPIQAQVPNFAIIGTVEGIHYSKGRRVTLYLLEKTDHE
jgi:4-amino-4-deoxy-L-arabinose transferase-like glycosyltransferase